MADLLHFERKYYQKFGDPPKSVLTTRGELLSQREEQDAVARLRKLVASPLHFCYVIKSSIE
jgi:hypothetical protein